MTTYGWRTALAAAVGCAALMLAGCGGGDEPAAGDSSATETEVAATGDDTPDVEATEPGDSAEEPSEDAAAAAGLPDACGLLTSAEIESVTGDSLEAGALDEELSTGEQGVCHFAPATDPFPIVQVIVVEGPGAGFDLQMATAVSMMGDEVEDIDIPGASQAFVVAGGAIIGMAVGDHYLQVSYLSTSTDDVTDITSALAELAAAAL